ncbi:hypothetical protein BYT27DRAFT_7078383 [Phlegmacium glaucopus]|nr:hypothetical protein BYT27DRAFT_7078383 [Phlegmacium glaucopus]
MGYHIAEKNVRLSEDILERKTLFSTADKDLVRVLRQNPINPAHIHSRPPRLSFIETQLGIATLVLARNPATSEQVIIDDFQAAKDYLDYAIKVAVSPAGNEDIQNQDDGCEILYGRAGLLYALLYLRKALRGDAHSAFVQGPLEKITSDTNLSCLIESIISRGKHGSQMLSADLKSRDTRSVPPLMWRWHGKRYLGGAHGVAGILQIILNCPFPLYQTHIQDIIHTILWLVDCQDESGNWPTKCATNRVQSGGSSGSHLVQWCHGAPGIIILLATVLRIFKENRESIPMNDAVTAKIRTAIRCGAALIYKCGLLRKGVGLCHGTAGSVYALLSASAVLDTPESSNRPIFIQAVHLAHLATFHRKMTVSKQMSLPDHPWSLYEGLAGMCCAWAEILHRMDSKGPHGMPGYDDLVFST